MDRESKYLLHLLGAWLREEAPSADPDVDWEKLVELGRIHNVMGILGYMTMTNPLCPDAQLQAFLRSACLKTISTYANRGALAEEFSGTLAQGGIDHIIMKGMVLRDFFPVPELRTFSDVDLVIRPEDRQKCHALMLEQGFAVKTDWEPVYSYTRGIEFYEIHTEIMEIDVSDKADFRAYFLDAWGHTQQKDTHRYEFVPEYHFLYMLTHIAKHVTGSGAGIRMYLDPAVFLRHYGADLNWAYIEQELQALALSDFANTVLTLIRDCFGITGPAVLKPMGEEVVAQFLEFTMAGGIFGREAQNGGIHSLEQQSRGTGEISKTGTLLKRLFPSARSIQSRYTYLQEKPWLLPAAWVHRFAATKVSWREHTRQAQDILSADKAEVQKLTRLYRDIGL